MLAIGLRLFFGSLIAVTRHVYQVNLRIVAEPGRAVGVIKALRSITFAARVESGFISSRIYQEVGNPDALCLEQDWSSEPELKSHIRSSCFTDLLMLMETAVEAPMLEVHSVSEIRGLEFVEAVRFGPS